MKKMKKFNEITGILQKFINRPLQAEITKKQGEEIYTLHLNRFGDVKRDIYFKLTEDQLKSLSWWY